MSEDSRLKIAEAYYTVADDLARNALDQQIISERLNRYADYICETKIAADSAKELDKELNTEKIETLRTRLTEAEALLRECADEIVAQFDPHDAVAFRDRIDAFLGDKL